MKCRNTSCSSSTDLSRVNVHLVERVDGDEDVPNIRVNLISGITTLKLVCDCVLEKKETKEDYCYNIVFVAFTGTFIATCFTPPPVLLCACDLSMCYFHETVINSAVCSLPGSSTAAERLGLKDDQKYPLATQAACIIQ